LEFLGSRVSNADAALLVRILEYDAALIVPDDYEGLIQFAVADQANDGLYQLSLGFGQVQTPQNLLVLPHLAASLLLVPKLAWPHRIGEPFRSFVRTTRVSISYE
jgi:hypothetical protein